MSQHTERDITAALVSRDPFFLFASRALLGRSRRIRIYATVSDLAMLRNGNSLNRVAAVICDLDTVEDPAVFNNGLCDLLRDVPSIKVLCVGEGVLPSAPNLVGDAPIHALLSKSDLGYSLHLAIQAVVAHDAILLSPRSSAHATANSHLARHGQTIKPEVPHPNLTERIAEIVMWRIFIGLDNPDIRDELLLGDDTVRGYVSMAYQALGATNELEAFDALSDWWWMTRFAPLMR